MSPRPEDRSGGQADDHAMDRTEEQATDWADDHTMGRTEEQAADRAARAALGYLAEPGDTVLGALLRRCPPAQVLAALMAGRHPLPGEDGPQTRPLPGQDPLPGLPGLPGRASVIPGHASSVSGRASAIPGLDRSVQRWTARLSLLPADGQAGPPEGLRLICPGDAEWPSQLSDLGDSAPVALWLRGSADLRFACLRSVSVVGARAATPYGLHVTTELAASLAERGCGVVSGGAFGIDAAAHRGALATGGVTVAVLASGLAYGYPRSHAGLFSAICEQGVLVSEVPPDRRPTRPGFLVRNRVIAALSRGTVVVEAALRSGALSTAARARDLCRPLMAVPGPVTSSQSAGCHEAIREWGAVLVTGAADVLEHISPVGEELAGPRRGPVLPRDDLDPLTRAVLEAVPAGAGAGPATIAVAAGVSMDTVLGCLGSLAAAGFVERSVRGWRARKDP